MVKPPVDAEMGKAQAGMFVVLEENGIFFLTEILETDGIDFLLIWGDSERAVRPTKEEPLVSPPEKFALRHLLGKPFSSFNELRTAVEQSPLRKDL